MKAASLLICFGMGKILASREDMEKYMKNLTAARLNAGASQAERPHTMLQFAPATKHKRLAICLGGEILQNPGMCFVFILV